MGKHRQGQSQVDEWMYFFSKGWNAAMEVAANMLQEFLTIKEEELNGGMGISRPAEGRRRAMDGQARH